MTSRDPAIRVSHLSVVYDVAPVLWDVCIDFVAGSRTAIMGPNGAGKTTLIKVMMGLLPKLSGVVQMRDDLSEKTSIAYVPQRNEVDWDFPMTTRDLVLMGTYASLRWFQRPGPTEVAAAEKAMRQTGILPLATRQIGKLSGGEQQRAFLARALAQNPSLFLLDEPMSAIDAATQRELANLLRDVATRGCTVIASHHDLATVGDHFEQVVLLNREVIASGPVETTLTDENLHRTYAS